MQWKPILTLLVCVLARLVCCVEWPLLLVFACVVDVVAVVVVAAVPVAVAVAVAVVSARCAQEALCECNAPVSLDDVAHLAESYPTAACKCLHSLLFLLATAEAANSISHTA